MRPCPHCAEVVQDAAVVCGWCGGAIPRRPARAWLGSPSLPVLASIVVVGAIAVAALLVAMRSDADPPPAAVPETQPEPFTYVAQEWVASRQLIDDLRVFNDRAEESPLGRELLDLHADASERCWAGFNADFPLQTLITLIWPNRQWIQFTPDISEPLGYDDDSILRGADYREVGLDPEVLGRLERDFTTYTCGINPVTGGIGVIRDAG